jgi:hypothetical protein
MLMLRLNCPIVKAAGAVQRGFRAVRRRRPDAGKARLAMEV